MRHVSRTYWSLVLAGLLSSLISELAFAQDFWVKCGAETPIEDTADVAQLIATPDGALFVGLNERVSGGGVYAVLRSTDGGSSWTRMTAGLPARSAALLCTDSVSAVYAARDSILFRLRFGEQRWDTVFIAKGPIQNAVANSQGLIVLSVWASLYRSSDFGKTWSEVFQVIDWRSGNYFFVYEMFSMATGTIIGWASEAKYGPARFRSYDGSGLNWVVERGWPRELHRMASSPRTKAIVATAEWDMLVRSYDDGATYELIDSTHRLYAMLYDSYGRLYASEWGVYVSGDEGTSWQDITYNLPYPVFGKALALDREGHLYVGRSWHSGQYNALIWKSAAKVTGLLPGSGPGVPEEVRLEQNYPNPFNPSTMIRYSLPHRLQVELSVFNVLGQRVMTLVSGMEEAGSHEVPFNANGLASGVYVYRLQAGSAVQIRKMLLLQ